MEAMEARAFKRAREYWKQSLRNGIRPVHHIGRRRYLGSIDRTQLLPIVELDTKRKLTLVAECINI